MYDAYQGSPGLPQLLAPPPEQLQTTQDRHPPAPAAQKAPLLAAAPQGVPPVGLKLVRLAAIGGGQAEPPEYRDKHSEGRDAVHGAAPNGQ